MTLITGRLTARMIIMAALAVLALALWSASTSAQVKPPFQVYGEGQPGDTITVYDENGVEQGATTVGADGSWFVQIETSADTLHQLQFTVNGEPVAAEVTRLGSTLAEITLTPIAPDDNATMSEGDDELSEEEVADGQMMAEDEMMEEESIEDEQIEVTYPDSGSGGLAESGPSTAALIGTVLVLAGLALGLGIWRIRTRT